MAETVKIGEEQKKRLERLLARLLIERDKKISFQEALSRAVDHALEDEGFVQKLAGTPSLEEDYAWQMLDRPKRTGIRDLSEGIDRWLYGGT